MEDEKKKKEKNIALKTISLEVDSQDEDDLDEDDLDEDDVAYLHVSISTSLRERSNSRSISPTKKSQKAKRAKRMR